MYAALWRVLPGPVWLRVVIVVLMVVGIALGQVLDGDPTIANAVIKFFSDRRE